VARIAASSLTGVVSHRRLILPILGAPGISAHEVQKRTGFSVAYATIRAEDIPEYLDHGELSSPSTRELSFTLRERAVLVPVELVLVLKSVSLVGAALYLAAALLYGDAAAVTSLAAYLGAVFIGIAVAPVLLPFLPGRSFALKGALAGVIFSTGLYFLGGGASWSLPVTVAAFLALPALSAFYTLNFTGCTPYTSRSGVKKEMRLGLPVMGGALTAALVLVLVERFF